MNRTDKPAAPERLNNIQAVRALAALAVVVFHFQPHYVAMNGSFPPLSSWALWGYAGVDVFFVTSGFVMWHSTQHRPSGTSAAGNFLRRRVLRVYVGYLPFLLLRYFTLEHYSPTRLDSTSWSKSVLLTSVHEPDLILGISWSLSYELYFYLLFAVTLLLPRRFLLPVWAGIAVVIGALFAADAELEGWIATWLSPFVLEFVAGVFLAASSRWWNRAELAPVFGLLIVAGIWLGVTADGGVNRVRIITFGLAAVGIIGLAVVVEKHLWSVGQLVSAAGDGSYALYLVHLTAIMLFFFWGWREWFAELGRYGPELAVLLFVVVTTAFSMLWYRLVEGPTYRAIVGWKPLSPKRTMDQSGL